MIPPRQKEFNELHSYFLQEGISIDNILQELGAEILSDILNLNVVIETSLSRAQHAAQTKNQTQINIYLDHARLAKDKIYETISDKKFNGNLNEMFTQASNPLYQNLTTYLIHKIQKGEQKITYILQNGGNYNTNLLS